MMGYGLWVMGTTSAYAREGTVEIVHWPSPVRFGTSVTPSGKVVPMKNPLHSCKYSAAAGLKDIVLPEVQLSCQVRKALDVLHLQLNVLPVFKVHDHEFQDGLWVPTAEVTFKSWISQ